MLNTAGEVRMNSSTTFFNGLLHMDSPDWTAKTCIHQLCADTACCLEDFPRAMIDRDWLRERERESVKGIHAVSTPSWWRW